MGFLIIFIGELEILLKLNMRIWDLMMFIGELEILLISFCSLVDPGGPWPTLSAPPPPLFWGFLSCFRPQRHCRKTVDHSLRDLRPSFSLFVCLSLLKKWVSWPYHLSNSWGLGVAWCCKYIIRKYFDKRNSGLY